MKNVITRQDGFGLVEVVISMVLLALLGTAVFYFLGGQSKGTAAGTDLTKGVHHGKQKLDSLKVLPYSYITMGSDTVASRYIRSWKLTTATGRKTITMNVYWPLTAQHHISLHTVVGDDQYKLED